jgi:hypothetical protein
MRQKSIFLIVLLIPLLISIILPIFYENTYIGMFYFLLKGYFNFLMLLALYLVLIKIASAVRKN